MTGKHRLIFLGALVVGLILFYLGMNNWMKQEEQKIPPAPVVIKRAEPEKQQWEEQKKLEVDDEKSIIQEGQQTAENPTTQVAQQPPKEEELRQKTETPKTPQVEQQEKQEKTVAKKETKKVTETTKKKTQEELKTFVFQVGAFRNKENAQKVIRIAEKEGLSAKIIEKEGFYKVRVYAKAPSYEVAYKKVKSHFKDAFAVRD